MADNQAMNREEYLRRYIATFIMLYGVDSFFQSWVIVDGIKYDFEIKKVRIDNDDNGFIQ